MESKRLDYLENNALLSLFAVTNALRDAEPLEARLRKLPRGWQMYKSCVGQVQKLIALVELSMPREQMFSVERNRGNLKYSIAIKGPAGRPDDSNGWWLSHEAIEALAEGAQEKCIMCTLDRQEQRKCKLAKALDEMPVRNADEHSAGCRYHNGLY